MPPLPFQKFQGTGNDFIMIDNRSLFFPKENFTLISRLCHRRFGIGADGLILLENADEYDFRMVYFNANGREGSMCGNGGRCTVMFAHQLGLFTEKAHFLAVDGPHEAYLEEGLVRLKMNDVKGIEENKDHFFLDTGSPHYVAWVSDLENYDVVGNGRTIRNNERFQEKGTNVNFVQQLGNSEIAVRTYERGVEDETYSCGTGVTACALVTHLSRMATPLRIHTKGGELEVSFQAQAGNYFHDIYLKGPAKQVFEGTCSIP